MHLHDSTCIYGICEQSSVHSVTCPKSTEVEASQQAKPARLLTALVMEPRKPRMDRYGLCVLRMRAPCKKLSNQRFSTEAGTIPQPASEDTP